MAALSGCAEDLPPATEIDSASANLSEGTWTFCAKQGQHCTFSGTRNVRYSMPTRTVVRTFTNAVHCDGSLFGAKSDKKANCNYSSVAVNGGTAGGAPSAGKGGSAGSSSTAAVGGTAAGSSAAGTAGSGDVHATHGMAGTVAGPYIDKSAVPEGDPGVSTVNIGTTSEAPGGSDGVGAFRTRCEFSHMLNDDPLVYPGQPGAAHLHAFFGNTDVDAYATQASVRNSGNSTCRAGTANRSSYWVPALIDAGGKPVTPDAIDVYYKSGYNGIAPQAIKPFPSGLRVIAGSAKASAAQAHAYWGCRENYIGHPGSIPQCPAGDQLIMFVELPQCWDGKNLDSTDHASHMAYPENGKCPSTHPVPIPAVTFNVMYAARDTTGWRLASDMYDRGQPGGYSGHADWYEGWDPAVAAAFVKNCINAAVDCHSHLLGDGRMIF